MRYFFIRRPIFSAVVSIVVVLLGLFALITLPLNRYPQITPPVVQVTAVYPGATAEDVAQAVAAPIEQQLSGLDGLIYFKSANASDGTMSLSVYFDISRNIDLAAVDVQNQVALAQPQLPQEVVRQGITVKKAQTDILLVTALQSDDPRYNSEFLSNYSKIYVEDELKRVPGVGDAFTFGQLEFSMLLSLDPDRLAQLGLTVGDVATAVQEQNATNPAGRIGREPAPAGTQLTIPVTTLGRLKDRTQFENIIVRARADGSLVRVSDIGRVTLGARNYDLVGRVNGKPTANILVYLRPGANALDVKKALVARLNELSQTFPQGVHWSIVFDTTPFITESISEVVTTLFEAMALVTLVVFVFLQSWRATLIPVLAVPVSIIGTFFGLELLGFSINLLTLFGLVLAIGIVVDDAIVVIENVERIMTEENLSPKDATRKAMGQITGAIVAITVVLAAVFVPSALQPGATGVIYKQFALTIAVSMGFSAVLALSFTPALCASFLKPEHDKKKNIVYRKFNELFSWVTHTYTGHVGGAVRHAPRWMLAFVLVAVLGGFLYTRLPGSFLPEEDQGYALAVIQLPPGATKQRTSAVMKQMRDVLNKDSAVEGVLQVTGFSFIGSGENAGMAFIKLKDWAKRDVTAAQFIQRANGEMQQVHDARIFVANIPTVQGLGQFGGFDMYLQDRGGAGRDALTQARNTLLGKASQDKLLTGVRPNSLEDAPQLHLDVDRVQAQSMGLSVGDIYNAISLMLAPVYVNDFTYGGRVKRVIMQADAPYRMGPEALQHIFTPGPSATGSNTPQMIPLSNVVHTRWDVSSPSLTRYNGYSAVEIVGSPAPGHASGEAMSEMEKIVNNDLPKGFGFDWTGQSYQEILSGNAATLLMVLSIVIVFLALAALYESWSIPVAVLLVVPLGLLGTVVFTLLRGLPDDIYFKIGLITVIGLAAKNAILIVEFAVEQQLAGKTLRDAVVTAARLRLRPILMTSLAFILGVFPLFISSGAGANARHAIGTGVIGGMLFATFLGVLLIPVFYVVVRRLLGDKLDGDVPPATQTHNGMQSFDSDPHRGT
ncbi:MAG TPA: multidrug efflux RND transporter permease subunit [Rhodanobacter sp.]|nr:multidrug efflux RND transporter permease subunit [Rhodanobacter sp.]